MASSQRGAGAIRKIDPEQSAFHWVAGGSAMPPAKTDDPPATIESTSANAISKMPVASPPAKDSKERASGKVGTVSPALAAKRPFRETVERYLREQGIPYINVDEAKKALFAGAKLRSFHFVVYRPHGKNWLLHTAQMRKELRDDLQQWENIFGDGFLAVVAKQTVDAKLRFQTLKGETVELR